MNKLKTIIVVILVFGLCGAAFPASESVGTMVGLKGTAHISREAGSLTAALKAPIELKDSLETETQSRAKVLFIDESMLTLGPSTKANIEKFVYSKEGGGASIFNLMDGAMRSVVGKTAFEVHTPTSVAAARGTVFDTIVGMIQGVPFTTILCYEGTVLITSADPSITDVIELTPGQTITIYMSQPLPNPTAAAVVIVSADDRGRLKKVDETGVEETPPPAVPVDIFAGYEDIFGAVSVTEALPPITQEPAASFTPVSISIVFPQ